MDQIIQTLMNFINTSDIGVAMKLVLGLALTMAGWFMSKWAIKAVRQYESEKQIQNRQEMTKENKKENEQAKDDSKAVDDFLK